MTEKIDKILNRGTITEILPDKKSFRKLLLSGRKLRFYIGFDATSPVLHLSHAKNFMLMEKFRLLGHEVIILFGDFTARIGDPSGEKSSRRQLSRKEVTTNVKKWRKMIEPLMDFKTRKNPPKIMYNHDWLSGLKLEEIMDLASNFTVQQMIIRDMFQERLKEKKPIYLHEFLYPLMQGYDSVAMNVDVEVCGTDQIFNALAGRTLLKKLKDKDKYVVALTLMENPKTGELMSKSKGTGVFLNVSANDMFGQIMSQSDEMIELLFINNTLLPLKEIRAIIKKEKPISAKKILALEIVKIFHGNEKAEKAAKEFDKIFKKKELPSQIPQFKTKKNHYSILNLLFDAKLVLSKNEAKRLIESGGVSIKEKDKKTTIKDWKEVIKIKDKMVIQVGKRKFLKINQIK